MNAPSIQFVVVNGNGKVIIKISLQKYKLQQINSLRELIALPGVLSLISHPLK